jgi:hypothetical protein
MEEQEEQEEPEGAGWSTSQEHAQLGFNNDFMIPALVQASSNSIFFYDI